MHFATLTEGSRMRLRSRLIPAYFIAVLTSALLSSGASAATGTPGAAGIGDPYFPLDGNGGYDVAHYGLRLTYEPSSDTISGTATLLAHTTKALSRFNLDFLLHVDSVKVNNSAAVFVSRRNGELVVTPAAPVAKGGDLLIVVNYRDVPSNPAYTLNGYNAWTRTSTGAVAVNAPQIAPWWYPSNDHPADKATYDISVAVPVGTEVLSNGVLVGTQPTNTGLVRWSWRSVHPQTPYDTTVAIGQYDDLRMTTTPSGLPFITAYANDLGGNGDAARASVERTPEIVEFEAENFGPYPFEAQGGVVVGAGEAGFAVEDQTRPVYGDKLFRSGANTYAVVHENAHQWFGDSVSVTKWSDVWLNEGFARYAEYLWSEHIGEGTAAEVAQYTYDTTDDFTWQIPISDPGTDFVFDLAVYDRGAMTLQALRTAVGDAAFFKILRTWAAEHRDGNATTAQFTALAERVARRDLGPLFATWLFSTGKPAVGPNGTADPATTATPKSFQQISETNTELGAGLHPHL
ncbi:MAG TPA: M1 family metallopeptidase [Actinophytocola sp.]|nr:M1 family metallopeptidase [Actinophytocola sp.]